MDQLDNRRSGFWRLLLRWLWTVKTPLKMLATDAKNAKSRTRSEFFYDGRKFRRQCVNVIDTTWGRIYFSTCENFGRKIRTRCAMALNLKLVISVCVCVLICSNPLISLRLWRLEGVSASPWQRCAGQAHSWWHHQTSPAPHYKGGWGQRVCGHHQQDHPVLLNHWNHLHHHHLSDFHP